MGGDHDGVPDRRGAAQELRGDASGDDRVLVHRRLVEALLGAVCVRRAHKVQVGAAAKRTEHLLMLRATTSGLHAPCMRRCD